MYAFLPCSPGLPRFSLPQRTNKSARRTSTACLAACASGTAQHLATLTKWFRGDFDNYYQVAAERAAEMPFRERHEHMHCRVMPVPELSTPEAPVVFANYYYDGRPHIVYRQRFYQLLPDSGGDVEMRIYKMTFFHGLRVAGCNCDLRAVDLGKLDDTELYEHLDGAQIMWRYEEKPHEGGGMLCDGAHFVGYMRDGGWTVYDDDGEVSRVIKDNLVLTKEDLWVAEETYNKDGVQVGGNKDGVAHKMQRVRATDEIRWTVDDALDFIDLSE